MSEYNVPGRFNPKLLSEELVTAFPFLLKDAGVDGRTALFTLSYDGAIHFRSFVDVPEKAFLSVLGAHNPNGRSKNEKRRDRGQVLAASIRQKLLGLGFTPEEIGFLHEFFSDEARTATQAITGRPV